MPPIPKLPAGVVAALGVVAVVLTVVQPHLSSPWADVAGIALAVLAALGVGATNTAIRGHAAQAHAAGLAEGKQGGGE